MLDILRSLLLLSLFEMIELYAAVDPAANTYFYDAPLLFYEIYCMIYYCWFRLVETEYFLWARLLD